MSTLRDALRDLPDAVSADLHESADAYLLVVDLPGVTAETVTIHATSAGVRIEGVREKSIPEGFSYRSEKRSLFLDAELPLPDDADAEAEAARATVERGVFELWLPKHDGGTGSGTTIAVEHE